jgi:dTDP-4-amino-4,6-dideoxygalactose transaminase
VIAVVRPVIGDEEIEAAVRVLRSGSVVQGPEVAAFEEEFSDLVGGRHCVAVNTGTSALQVTLAAMGVGRGDEVIVPSFSFAATANAVRLVGADPVFADIEPGSFCVDPDAVAAAIGPRTAAVMPVHLYGHPAAMDRLMPLARRHGLAVVEDACQAHGAALRGEPVGSFGTAGCFSFYPTKNMHSLEGGMVTTADASLAALIRLLRNQGMSQRYVHETVGANLRMTDVAAAVGRVQLTRLAAGNEQRRANAKFLDAHIAGASVPLGRGLSVPLGRGLSVPLGRGVVVPPVADAARHVYHQYTVRMPGDRDAARAALAERGVGSEVYYPTPTHRQAPYRESGPWHLPETERAVAQVLSLPVHPSLTPAELDRIADAVTAVCSTGEGP